MAPTTSLRARLRSQLDTEAARDLIEVLDRLRAGAIDILGTDLRGVYVLGSFALGRGDPASDVDFLVIGETPFSEEREVAIADLHVALHRGEEWCARRLEGSWCTAAALRDPVGAHEPWLYVDNGSAVLERSRHDDTWNSRWTLREAGLAAFGPDPATLLPPVAPGLLEAEAVAQADAKAAWIAGDPEALMNGWAQPYVVLTMCRLLWTATYGTVTSKSEAADWAARDVAPARFRAVILTAVAQRLRPFDADRNRADPGLVASAGYFVAWARTEIVRRAHDGPQTAST